MNAKRCIENIRYLAKEKSIKIGQIETEAGVTPGYLSRFYKEDNASLPNVEVLSAFAKALDVSIDALVNQEYPRLTSTDRFILEFLDNLTEKTILLGVPWTVQRPEDYHNIEIFDYDKTEHPLFIVKHEKGIMYPQYNSRFRGSQMNLVGDSFEAQTGECSYLYLMSLEREDGDPRHNQEYELYYVEGYEVNPLCHFSSDEESPFNGPLIQLYSAIRESLSHVRIAEDVKQALNAFILHGDSDQRPN